MKKKKQHEKDTRSFSDFFYKDNTSNKIFNLLLMNPKIELLR